MKHLSIFLCFAVIFATFLGGNVYAKDIEGYPTIPDIPEGYYGDYIIFKESDTKIKAYVVYTAGEDDGKPIANYFVASNGVQFQMTTNKYVYCISYLYVPANNNWSMQGSVTEYSAGSTTIINGILKYNAFIYSDNDIYNHDGSSVVFQAPPVKPTTLEEIIQVGVTEVREKTTETMMTIALCGVGCLALLMALPILSRVFSRYR